MSFRGVLGRTSEVEEGYVEERGSSGQQGAAGRENAQCGAGGMRPAMEGMWSR